MKAQKRVLDWKKVELMVDPFIDYVQKRNTDELVHIQSETHL